MIKKLPFLLFIFVLPMLSLQAQNLQLKDQPNYTSIKIGQQVWMGQNLNADSFRNGETIMEAKSAEEWIKAGNEGKPAWCYYENSIENGRKYGKLYNWFAINDPRRLAPKGWHIPT